MRGLYPFFLLLLLISFALIGVSVLGWTTLFGVVIPAFAIAVFIIGFVWRIVGWARSPVPFKITTTCGQQKSMPWVKNNELEAPQTTWGVIGRMLLEILFFRSLFRNTRADLTDGRLVYGASKWLWAFGLLMHWTFLIIILRHFRFFIEPTPGWVINIQNLDGLMQIGVPVIFMSGVIFAVAVTYLFLRRVAIPQVRYFSLAADYFPLYLLFSIGLTGIMMRYLPPFRVDIVKVKELATGLLAFNPVVPEGIGAIFYIHFFLVSLLLIYFPFSKLMHLGGVFLSPTRNMKNDSRVRRHVNPWDYPVKTHPYEEWEEEFHDVMKAAGMPLEKEHTSEKEE